jgi:hypothetical protein
MYDGLQKWLVITEESHYSQLHGYYVLVNILLSKLLALYVGDITESHQRWFQHDESTVYIDHILPTLGKILETYAPYGGLTSFCTNCLRPGILNTSLC